MRLFSLIMATMFFLGCNTKKETLVGIWKTEDGKEKLFIHKLYNDIIVDYSTEVMGHSITVFSTEAEFNDSKLTLKNTFFGNRTWPHTILYKANLLIYQNRVFKTDQELTSLYLQSIKEQEEKEKLNSPDSSPFISNPDNSNIGRVSKLLTYKSHDELIAAFGNKAERLFTAMIGKTEIPFGSVLYKNDVNQVIFVWKDNSFSTLQALFITPKIEGNKYLIPDWEFEGNIKVGMTVAELLDLNSKKIDFMGLGNFDKSGMVLSYNNGELSKYNVYPEVETTGNPLVYVYNNFAGYKKITSDDKYFDKLSLRVRSIWVFNNNHQPSTQTATSSSSALSGFLEDYLKYNSHNALVNAFGPDNVQKKEITDNGSELQFSSVIFPNTDKQLNFNWMNSNFTGLKSISDEIGNGEYAKPVPSFYSTHEGLSIKQSLKDICILNQKPVTFYGFEWDNSGNVINWNNGTLQTSGLDVVLGYSGEIPYSKGSILTGNVTLKSDSKEVQESGINIFVRGILVYPKLRHKI